MKHIALCLLFVFGCAYETDLDSEGGTIRTCLLPGIEACCPGVNELALVLAYEQGFTDGSEEACGP